MKFSEVRYSKCGSINLLSWRVSEPHEIELRVEIVPECLCTIGV
ncbi:MAG: hypothetical protein Q7J35_12485 [Candidatus Methanoperedens sp.]|nr:hypothetical protein [Candidatus Methanoperedens sp.]